MRLRLGGTEEMSAAGGGGGGGGQQGSGNGQQPASDAEVTLSTFALSNLLLNIFFIPIFTH